MLADQYPTPAIGTADLRADCGGGFGSRGLGRGYCDGWLALQLGLDY